MLPKAKQMRHDAAFKLKVVKWVTESNNSNAARVHNYKNQIILHLTIDFHYKAIINYHNLVFLVLMTRTYGSQE